MDLITKLIDAMSTYDVEKLRPLFASDARHWVSLTEQEQGLEALLGVMARERDVVASATFEVRSQVATETGAVIMLTVDGVTKSGSDFHIPACLVLTIEDDKITRLDEYANTEKAKQLIRDIYAG